MSSGRAAFRVLRRLRQAVPAAGALGIALALAGCGSSPLDSYSLVAPTHISGKASSRQMIVTEPVATLPYDSERIVVRTGPEGVAYLKGAQWAERLPRHLQAMMVQAFENARLLRSVGRPGDRFVADVSLNTDIRRFDIDVTTNEAVIEISAKVVREGSGRIVAARIFTARAPGSAADGRAASAAINQALEQALREIVAWAAAARA